MRRTGWIAVGLSLVVVVGFAGSLRAGFITDNGVVDRSLVGVWHNTQRWVEGVEEDPIASAVTFRFYADGRYAAFNGTGEGEHGTCGVKPHQPTLILHSSKGDPARRFERDYEFIDSRHFRMTYELATPAGSVSVKEIYTWQPLPE